MQEWYMKLASFLATTAFAIMNLVSIFILAVRSDEPFAITSALAAMFASYMSQAFYTQGINENGDKCRWASVAFCVVSLIIIFI